jgi:predicted double-glycine peptidase
MIWWSENPRRFCVALIALFVMSASARSGPVLNIRSLKEIREKAVVMQKFDNSCAAAALATVLTYGLQDPVTERYIAGKMLEKTEPAKVKSRGGFSLLDMKRFVEALGYRAEAYQHLALEDLTLFHAPIVPIKVHGMNHYVVLNAVSGDQVLLADPAFGNRAMPVVRFKDLWMDGLAFVINPK